MATPVIFAGRGAPARALGRDGAWYIDMKAWNRHGPKANGVWPAGVPIIPAAPTIADDLPLATKGGLTLTTDAGAKLAGDIR